MKNRFLVIFFILLIFTSFSISAKDYFWEEISTNVYLKSDGTAQVSEIQKFNFSGDFTYAFRYFHFDEIKEVRDFRVYDETGREYSVQSYNEGKYKVFKWFYTAKDEKRTFILNYTLVGPVKQGLFQDKVFWTGVFKDHEKIVEKATINFNFYDLNQNRNKIKYQIYPEADSYFENSALIAKTKSPLNPYTPFEMIITAPVGVLAPEKIYFLCFKIILLVLIFSLVVSIFFRYKKEHELFGKELKIPAFEKSEIRYVNLRPAIVGLLMSGKTQRKEILATITDLARRGYIHINVVKKFLSQDFELLRLRNNRDELLEYEKMTLTMLFKNKDKILMSELKIRPTILGDIEKILEEIYAEAKRQNLYEENPETVKKSYQRRALVYIILPLVALFFNIFYSPNKNGNIIWSYLFFLAIVFIVLILKKTGSRIDVDKKDFSKENTSKKYFKESSKKDILRYLCLIFLIIIFGLISKEGFISLLNITFGAGFISGIIILFYSGLMDKKTEKGLSDFYKYKNLKSWMEKYPLKEERMFNEFLPYSIVFGIHKKWANKFESSVQDEHKQISWYSGYSGSFASSFSSFSVSATSFGTNSGSGGGFGGSSGGGGGGGGSGGGGGGAG